jgi:hypothetical protein
MGYDILRRSRISVKVRVPSKGRKTHEVWVDVAHVLVSDICHSRVVVRM